MFQPSAVLLEIYRVLGLGAIADFLGVWISWMPKRLLEFSRDAIVQLVEDSGFCIQNLSVTVGPFTGFIEWLLRPLHLGFTIFTISIQGF